ncbi:C-type mannose receptor 2-like [Mercenaria mercenaria]|uniref:C-type mannose receptor 2-like n=1 Tax=Mercenaria mercenaria TaxID=6596 RepID=UPI00234F2802|nr:C-type mannose receptor 2-like [Mercenaria mercenaria]
MTAGIFWTGLHSKSHGVWGWYTQDYFNQNLVTWQVEPNDLAGAENCGVLRMTGRFSDRNCSSDANFICNKPQYTYDKNIDNGCGPWIRAGRSCYGFIKGSQAGSWAEARKYCQSMGADLIKVDSFAEKMWLELQLMSPANDRLFWTGLNDRSSEATYVWADGTPFNITYIKWNQEPNNFKGNEDCALISSLGVYNDVPCITQAAAICEIDIVTKDPCQVGWIRSQKNCYMFTSFDNSSLLYNQIEATAFCKAAGGKLLSVNDRYEKEFIVNQVKNQLPENIRGYWTSLTDKGHEGFWSFGNEMTDVPDHTLIDWTGEPSSNRYDDCGLVTFAGHYHMRDCSSKISFICEKDATVSNNDSIASNQSNGSNSTN